MPTYEYRCPDGHVFDVFQRMSDEPRAKCPTCGADADRQISAGAGLLFKGSGFYITDSRSSEYAKKASAEQGQGTDDGKTESAAASGAKEGGGSGESSGSAGGSSNGSTGSSGKTESSSGPAKGGSGTDSGSSGG